MPASGHEIAVWGQAGFSAHSRWAGKILHNCSCARKATSPSLLETKIHDSVFPVAQVQHALYLPESLKVIILSSRISTEIPIV